MTIYTYDTEFLEDGSTVNLISIAIVCEDGREYYAVNSGMDDKRIGSDDWLMKNVVKHLPLHYYEEPRDGLSWIWSLDHKSTLVKPKWVIANEVREFLLARPNGTGTGEWQPNPELWAYFAAYDHVALAQLWGKMLHLPKGIPMYTHDLKQEMDRQGVGSDAVPKPANAHDALADARWNLEMLRKLEVVR